MSSPGDVAMDGVITLRAVKDPGAETAHVSLTCDIYITRVMSPFYG